MTAWFLSPHFPNLNPQHLIRYGLVHDLVEVHAGDTYIYGTDADIASKQAREEKALKKLQIDWYDFPELTTDIQAYEARNSAEAKFIYALDKIMPIMLAYIHNGYSWDQAKVTVDMLYKAKIDKVGVSPEILPYFLELHTLLLDHPELIKVR